MKTNYFVKFIMKRINHLGQTDSDVEGRNTKIAYVLGVVFHGILAVFTLMIIHRFY